MERRCPKMDSTSERPRIGEPRVGPSVALGAGRHPAAFALGISTQGAGGWTSFLSSRQRLVQML